MTYTRAWGVEYGFEDGDTIANDVFIDFDDARQAVIDHMIIMAYDEDGISCLGELYHTWGAIGAVTQFDEPGLFLIEDLHVIYTIYPSTIHHPSKHTGGTA
jgi:hypothetical protein